MLRERSLSIITNMGKQETGALSVICWRFLQRLPLLAVVAKDHQRHLFALNQLEKLTRTGLQLFFVVVRWPGAALRRKQALHNNCIDGQKNRPGLWQPYYYRLMPGRMPAGFNERETWPQLEIAIDQPVAQGRVVPMRSRRRVARMACARHFVVGTLDDAFRVRKRIVIASMIDIKVCADQEIDLLGPQSQVAEVL